MRNAAAETHVGGFLVVVDVVDTPGQAEVCDLHHVVSRHQDVPGGQVPVDALQKHRQKTDLTSWPLGSAGFTSSH